MSHAFTRSLRWVAGVAAVLPLALWAHNPALAQVGPTMPDPAIPCPAFARDNGGGWTVVAPVTLDFAGMLISYTVGTSFAPGSTSHGLAIPVILDRECGNRPSHAMRP